MGRLCLLSKPTEKGILNWKFLGNWFLRDGKRPFFRLFQNTWWNSSQIYRIYLSKSHILKKKSFYFGWRISWWYMYTHDRSCTHSRLAVCFTILTLQNILKMHFTVKYLKFWRNKILIGFCILCTFFQINISLPKLSLKHLPLKYDFITINIFIWVANKTLIQKK